MSSIWNPQDRFILSNMTSEKLYAKSPLTTGVSGTSAYIGLEPSATYNETVLFSGNLTATNSTGALSEPPSAFNMLRVEWYGENISEYGLKTNTFANDGNNFAGLACGGLAQVYDNYAMGFHFGMLALTNDKVTLVRQARTNFTTGTIGAFTSGNGMFRLQKIVGINRKEV